jgi:DNA ligase-1
MTNIGFALQPLLHKSLKERRELLREYFKEVPGEFLLATAKEFEDTEELQVFLNESIENQCEGLMIKAFETNAEYIPAKRSYNWLKLKKDYMEGMTDSLDLVPIGSFRAVLLCKRIQFAHVAFVYSKAAWYGQGKRTGVYGSFLLAVYDDENEEYQTVCKIGTGFSDQQLTDHTAMLKQHIIPSMPQYYRYVVLFTSALRSF